MPAMIPKLQSWCLEAASLFGDDWPQVREYVKSKLAALSDAERETLNREAALTFTTEVRGERTPH
jgi:hypothetical protein